MFYFAKLSTSCQIGTKMVISVLVTDAGNGLCWWQVWDFDDGL